MFISIYMYVVWYSTSIFQTAFYEILLALNSNLTSIFNRSSDITPSLLIYTPPLFQVKVDKYGWE